MKLSKDVKLAVESSLLSLSDVENILLLVVDLSDNLSGMGIEVGVEVEEFVKQLRNRDKGIIGKLLKIAVKEYGENKGKGGDPHECSSGLATTEGVKDWLAGESL